MTPKLKITAIKPYPVWVGTRNQLIVKVETRAGTVGGIVAPTTASRSPCPIIRRDIPAPGTASVGKRATLVPSIRSRSGRHQA